jgi:hypothetical protein
VRFGSERRWQAFAGARRKRNKKAEEPAPSPKGLFDVDRGESEWWCSEMAGRKGVGTLPWQPDSWRQATALLSFAWSPLRFYIGSRRKDFL